MQGAGHTIRAGIINMHAEWGDQFHVINQGPDWAPEDAVYHFTLLPGQKYNYTDSNYSEYKCNSGGKFCVHSENPEQDRNNNNGQ